MWTKNLTTLKQLPVLEGWKRTKFTPKELEIEEIIKDACAWGEERYPNAAVQRHRAFINSVAYLVTGVSGKYGGPTIRQHCVALALAGDGENHFNGFFWIQLYDERVKRAGKWSFPEACQFAEPICYGKLPSIAKEFWKEHKHQCYDDDPLDLVELETN